MNLIQELILSKSFKMHKYKKSINLQNLNSLLKTN